MLEKNGAAVQAAYMESVYDIYTHLLLAVEIFHADS